MLTDKVAQFHLLANGNPRPETTASFSAVSDHGWSMNALLLRTVSQSRLKIV